MEPMSPCDACGAKWPMADIKRVSLCGDEEWQCPDCRADIRRADPHHGTPWAQPISQEALWNQHKR